MLEFRECCVALSLMASVRYGNVNIECIPFLFGSMEDRLFEFWCAIHDEVGRTSIHTLFTFSTAGVQGSPSEKGSMLRQSLQ